MDTALIFEETKDKIVVLGHERPVLRLGKRLFVGEALSILNPNGFGGRVWSAMDLDRLKYNANLRRHDGTGN